LFKRWFPYYTKKSLLRKISSALNCRYNICFTCWNLKRYIYNDAWTINSEYIHILEQELLSFVENNERVIKTSIKNPGGYFALILNNLFYFNTINFLWQSQYWRSPTWHFVLFLLKNSLCQLMLTYFLIIDDFLMLFKGYGVSQLGYDPCMLVSTVSTYWIRTYILFSVVRRD